MLIDPASMVWLRCDRCRRVYSLARPGETGFSRCYRCGVPASSAAFTAVGFEDTPKGETISPLAMPNNAAA